MSPTEIDPPDPLAALRAAPDPRDPRAASLLVTPAHAGEDAWGLLGLPYDGGVPGRPGARFGPAAARQALAAFAASAEGGPPRPIADLGDLALPTMNGGEAHRRIEEAAAALFRSRRRMAFVGGDHGCTGSIVRGLASARPDLRLALVSVDAHLDVRQYPDEQSLSSGTPFRRALETPILDGSRFVSVGVRRFANSAHDLAWARDQGVRTYDVDTVAERGAVEVAREALEAVAADSEALYLSIDLDAADAAFAPGVSAPGTGGLTSREMIDLVRIFAAHPELIGFDVMELSPPHDTGDRTARLAARLLLEGVGARS